MLSDGAAARTSAEGPGVGMAGHDLRLGTAENYRRFAKETAGRSPAYERLSRHVAGSAAVLSFLETLPKPKRQPNLLFAAARHLLGEPPEEASLTDLVAAEPERLAAVMMARSTQTNEPARCATLLPALVGLPEPVALIEVGASAGLTLLVDRYSYDYGGRVVRGTDPLAPTLECQPIGPVPIPERVPEVSWRAGLDLHPLDVADPDDVAWLECLVWPDEPGRAERLEAAVACARRDPPVVRRGDLLGDLPALAGEAPRAATLVVYHSAVLPYVSESRRRAFAEEVRRLGAVWLSNEGPGVVPGSPVPPESEGVFVLLRNGTELLAVVDDHGTWARWLA